MSLAHDGMFSSHECPWLFPKHMCASSVSLNMPSSLLGIDSPPPLSSESPTHPSEAAQMSPSEDGMQPPWYIPQANCWLPPPPPICAPTWPQLCLDDDPSHGSLFYTSSCPFTPTRSWMIDFSVAIIDFPAAQTVKNLPTRQDTGVQSLGWGVPLEKGMAIHSSVLAWRIQWTENLGGLQFVGSQRAGHDWATNTVHGSWMTQRKKFIFYSSLCSHYLAKYLAPERNSINQEVKQHYSWSSCQQCKLEKLNASGE